MSGALALLGGVAVLGGAVAVLATTVERRRKAAAALSARLEDLNPAVAAPDGAGRPFGIRVPMPVFLRRALARADVTVRPEVLPIAGFGLLLAGAGAIYLGGPLAGAALVAAGLGGAWFVLQQIGRRRNAAFAETLPHFLDAIRQLLIAGNSFQQALLKALEGAAPAIRRYLHPAERRIRNGAPIADALSWTAERLGSTEIHMMAAAVRTNARFGGAIGPILQDLAKMLRERARVTRELSSATAETRISAILITCLPLAAMLLVAMLNFSYISYLWLTPEGRRLLAVALGFQLAGMMVMRRIMRLDF